MLEGAKYDVSLLAYLVDTNDIVKEISDVARRVDVTILASDEAVYGKGVKSKFLKTKKFGISI